VDPVLFIRCDRSETFGVGTAAMEAAGAPVRIWDAINEEPRPSLDEVSGAVLFGSIYNVEQADEQPFIKDVKEFTAEAVDRGSPFLGACFGAQVLAWALDGDVVKAPVREVGFEPIRPLGPASGDRLVSHYEDGDMAFQWHMDTFTLPNGAELLVTGDRVPNQAYRVNDRTWGIQFHFEIDSAEIDLWLDEIADMDLEAVWGKSHEEIRAERDRFVERHEQKGREVFRRFAEVCGA